MVDSVATTREVATSKAVFGQVDVGEAEVWVSEVGGGVVQAWVWVSGVAVGFELAEQDDEDADAGVLE